MIITIIFTFLKETPDAVLQPPTKKTRVVTARDKVFHDEFGDSFFEEKGGKETKKRKRLQH